MSAPVSRAPSTPSLLAHLSGRSPPSRLDYLTQIRRTQLSKGSQGLCPRRQRLAHVRLEEFRLRRKGVAHRGVCAGGRASGEECFVKSGESDLLLPVAVVVVAAFRRLFSTRFDSLVSLRRRRRRPIERVARAQAACARTRPPDSTTDARQAGSRQRQPTPDANGNGNQHASRAVRATRARAPLEALN